MQIQVKDPATGALLLLDAKPEKWHGEHGFRIRHANGSGFWMTSRSGTWQTEHGYQVNSGLLVNIGLALEQYPLKEQLTNHDDDER